MKRAFTLIEVIAVIIVLAVIAMIVVPSVNSSISKSKQKAYDSQIDIIIQAAKKWAVSNNNLLPTDNSVYKLPLATLISEKYINNIEDGKLKNPKDSSKTMDGCISIFYNENYNQYIYEYNEEC